MSAGSKFDALPELVGTALIVDANHFPVGAAMDELEFLDACIPQRRKRRVAAAESERGAVGVDHGFEVLMRALKHEVNHGVDGMHFDAGAAHCNLFEGLFERRCHCDSCCFRREVEPSPLAIKVASTPLHTTLAGGGRKRFPIDRREVNRRQVTRQRLDVLLCRTGVEDNHPLVRLDPTALR